MTQSQRLEKIDLLARARQGHDDCLGQLLELYRNYLHLVARTQIDLHLAVRASPSDVVQETFLQAAQGFDEFRGTTDAELIAWLRQILINNIMRAYERHVQAARRDIRREQRLDLQALDRSSAQVHHALAASGYSPSKRAEQEEAATQVADRLAALPSHYKEVIVLRNLEGLPFEEVAQRMGRTNAATRKLWARAIEKLKLREIS